MLHPAEKVTVEADQPAISIIENGRERKGNLENSKRKSTGRLRLKVEREFSKARRKNEGWTDSIVKMTKKAGVDLRRFS